MAAIARPALAATSCEGLTALIRCPTGELSTTGDLVGAAFVLRKLAVEVEVTEEPTAIAVRAYLGWPQSLRAFQTWLAAVDFLAAEVPMAYVGFLLQGAIRKHCRCGGATVKHPDDPMVTLGLALAAHLRGEVRSTADGTYEPMTGRRAPGPTATAAAASELLSDTLADVPLLEWLRCCEQLMRPWTMGDRKSSHAAALHLTHLRLSLLAYAEAPASARHCLEHLGAIADSGVLGASRLRWLVHVALRRLYLAEKAGEHWPLSLDVVCALQEHYCNELLNLDCFVPASRRPTAKWYYLDGLHGRGNVPPVGTPEEVQARLKSTVPWLQYLAAFRGQVPLMLTGSLLAWVLRASVIIDAVYEPADVDIFCSSRDDLHAAVSGVSRAMRQWLVDALGGDGGPELWMEAPNASRRILEVPAASAVRLVTLYPGLHICALRCDVYVNSLARVRCYHLPAVRCSLALAAEFDLVINPSCAIALATSLNVDYAIVAGKKSPLEILERKLHLGFNFCLPWEAAQQLREHLGRSMSDRGPSRRVHHLTLETYRGDPAAEEWFL